MSDVLAGIDPIAFEVIRHRLWAINDEQAVMAARLSGSPMVYEALDFNAGILSADGRGLYTGIYIAQHATTLDTFVRHVLDTWALEDIHDGDMFFTNDPWCGALHANDGILAAPIFWDGEIVAWSAIVMHDNDVGSPVPGSFVVGAEDRFGEAPLFPAIKMVENYELRPDLERAYLRNHRTPELNALNLRARLASLRLTRDRLHELIGQYGLDTFLAAQQGIFDYVERVVRRRLASLPDGTWFEQVYHDHDGIRDEMYPICCRLTKVGDELTIDFAGTAPQVRGSVNCARAAMEGSICAMMFAFLCYDLPWSVGAVKAVMTIVSEEGTINNAVSPAGVSMATIMAMRSTQDAVSNAFAKMLLCSERYREEAQACWSPGTNMCTIAGVDRHGQPVVGMLMDALGGGGGARTFTDGIDSGGALNSMSFAIPNVETTESRLPVLMLYRAERRDSSGHGRFRGGVGLEFAVLAHKSASPVTAITLASGVSQPEAHGLSGGTPAVAKSNVVYRGSDARAQFAAGRLPTSGADVQAERVEVMQAKQRTTLGPDDLRVCVVAGGGGFGDALLRDPARVRRDVAEGLVSEELGRAIYGVVLTAGTVDADATAAARTRIRDERLRDSRPIDGEPSRGRAAGGEVLHPVTGAVEAARVDGRALLRCAGCAHELGDYHDDYKRGTHLRELPLTAHGELNARARLDHVVLRQYVCPGCGASLAIDVQRREEPMLDECRFFAAPQEA